MKKTDSNLVSLAERSPEERSAIAKMGGIASGAARREKAGFRDKVRLLARTKVDYDDYQDTRLDEILAQRLFFAAINGNVKAISIVMDILGNESDEARDYSIERSATLLKQRQGQDALSDILNNLNFG